MTTSPDDGENWAPLVPADRFPDGVSGLTQLKPDVSRKADEAGRQRARPVDDSGVSAGPCQVIIPTAVSPISPALPALVNPAHGRAAVVLARPARRGVRRARARWGARPAGPLGWAPTGQPARAGRQRAVAGRAVAVVTARAAGTRAVRSRAAAAYASAARARAASAASSASRHAERSRSPAAR